MSDRNTLRSKIFSVQPKTKVVSYNGADIEVRQPLLKNILEAGSDTDSKQTTVRMLIQHCFVPGTSEQIFEEADYEAILNMPFSNDWIKLSEAMNELTGIAKEVETQKGN